MTPENLTPEMLFGDLGRLAEKEVSGVLKRALATGLKDRLWKLRESANAEHAAWFASALCGATEVFNTTLTLPGYEDARASVQQHIRKLYDGDAGKVVDRFHWGHIHSIRAAVAYYWLPLGLWALSGKDVALVLSRCTLPANVQRDNNGQSRKFFRASHHDLASEIEESATPTKAERFFNDSKGSNLLREANDLGLYRPRVAPCKIVTTTDGELDLVLINGQKPSPYF